ncbi:MAG: arylsulfatase [Bacteroidetes bacterium]|nr:arylsulfatase [Bacteroidota bacterium]
MSACSQLSDKKISSPNVLLILTDDQGYGDLSIHENDSIDTPTLDNLANEGARLDQFFVTPLCAPTRASLLTGRYHLRTGTYWVTRGTENMRSEEVTIAEVFKANNYATGCFGKWHNGAHYPYNPMGQGFDRFVGFCGGHWSNYFNSTLQSQDTFISTKGFITDVLTDSAISFIRQNKSQPFLCYVPYNAPHGPFQVPDKYFDKYKNKGLTDRNAAIYGMVENIDDNVNRLLATLNEYGLAENTIVVFMTDNGPNGNRFNGGMRGWKAHVHEGGVRVPAFIRWPGKIPAGLVLQEQTAVMDILPTLIDLCDIKPPTMPKSDGISLKSLLSGKSDSINNRTIFTHVSRTAEKRPYPGTARTHQYRLVANTESPELYDMINDPSETRNIASEKPELLQKLHNQYLSWYQEVTRENLPIPGIPIGYHEAPLVNLPAHEASISGVITYKHNRNGWAHDWIINWKNTTDKMEWDIEVIRPGKYQVAMLYTALPANLGSEVRVTVGEQSVRKVVSEAFIPQISSNLDRIKGRPEALDQTWARMNIGTLDISPGKQKIVLDATKIVGGMVGECKGLVITWMGK